MKKEYVFRYIMEGRAVIDNIDSDAHGQQLLKVELACGNLPATRSEVIILNEREIPENRGC